MDSFKNAAPSKYSTIALGSLSRILSKWRWVSRKLVVLGESLDFLYWVEVNYSPEVNASRQREVIWNKVIDDLNSPTDDTFSKDVLVIELGVAWGYTTSYFNERLAGTLEYKWFGFDTFTGLPREWRDHLKNDFSANGKIPNVSDSRISFEVGLVEGTFDILKHIHPFNDWRKVFLFDLDLFEPSLFVWEKIADSLKTGDVLYFDEAFDSDERQLLNNWVNVHPTLEFQVIGYTHLAIALMVIKN